MLEPKKPNIVAYVAPAKELISFSVCIERVNVIATRYSPKWIMVSVKESPKLSRKRKLI